MSFQRALVWSRRATSLALAVLPVACSSAADSADSASGSSGPLDHESKSEDELSSLYDGPALRGAEEKAAGLGGAGFASPESCLRVMSWGALGRLGTVPGEGQKDAIVDWLNTTSNVAAVHFVDKPEVDEDFLSGVDVVLLQNLADWEFKSEELDAFESWVKSGGGVMALAGYSSDDAQEVYPVNSLLSFSGLSFQALGDAGATSTALGVCGYCLGTTHRQGGFDPSHEISSYVEAVGAFQGREVEGDGDIVAAEEGAIYGMTKEFGQGRVFLFHDEWISYAGQWSSGVVAGCEDNLECSGVTPRETYQVPQLWLNSLRWLAPQTSCIAIDDERVR